MKSYGKALWLLGIGYVVHHTPGWYIGYFHTSAIGGVMIIAAMLMLSKRNPRLRKARNFTLCMYATSIAFSFSRNYFQRTDFTMLLRLVFLLIELGFLTTANYFCLNGLADMANEAERPDHAKKLQRLFYVWAAVNASSLLILIGNDTITLIVNWASTALAVCQLYLLVCLVKIERLLEVRREIQNMGATGT